MTQSVNAFKFCFILAGPWVGGHHLQNLIQTSDKFYNSIPADKLLSTYKITLSNKAHINCFLTMSESDQDYLIECAINSSKPMVLTGHLSTLILMQEKLEKAGQIKLILIEYPWDTDSLPYKRILKNLPNIDMHQLGEQNLLYKKDIIKKLFKLTDNNILDVGIDLYQSQDIDVVLKSIEEFVDTTFSIKECKEIHNNWLTKAYK